MSEWQPIETAPRDGSLVLLAMAGDFEPTLGRFLGGRWIDDFTDDLESACGFTATHWLPLPKTPSAAEQPAKEPAL